jgi:chloramphenicol 3-O-phosphotransferase
VVEHTFATRVESPPDDVKELTLAPVRAVFLITGPSASGKTTVARLLAERFRRGVHVEGDLFRRSVVSGRAEMAPDPSPEALQQLRLRYRLAAAASDVYFEAGFTVVVEDVVAGEELPAVAALVESRPLHVVVLLPTLEAVRARDASRETTGYARWPLEDLYAAFAERTPRLGTWLDTSNQTAPETVDAILSLTHAG